MIFSTTPSQTVGPFFAIGLPWPEGPAAVPEGTPDAIRIRGTITDGAGMPVPDHLIELWQADPAGRFADLHGYGGGSELPGFRGFARHGV
ncbi:MAG: protocatechuate 3,4-dioxygenase subunit alpha, partial [Solirubrobacteraceae bacterium]